MIGPQPAATARVPPHHSAAPPTFGWEAEALARFRRSHPEYDDTGRIDELRATEYARLDAEDQVYLDYTGGGLYAESQLRAHMELLRAQVFGNPHSINPTSLAATRSSERARTAVLRYFNASPDGVQRDLHSERDGCAQARGRGVPIRGERPPAPHLRQPQLGERAARVRAHSRRGDVIRVEHHAVDCAWTRTRSTRLSGTRTRSGSTCSRTRPSRTSRASSIRSTWIAEARRAGLGRPRRLRGLRSDQPPRPR